MIQSTDFYLLSLQEVKPLPWPQFRGEIEAEYRTRAPMTAAKIRQVLTIVENLNLAADGEPARSIERSDQLDLVLVHRFVAAISAGRKAITVKSLLMTLRAICGLAEESRRVMVSPFRLRKIAKWVGRIPKPTGKRHNTAEEVRAVLALAREDCERKLGWAQWRARRLYAVLAMLAYSGLRRNECMLLHVEDLDVDRGVVNLVPRTKSGRLKTEASAVPIAMPPVLRSIIREWLEHRLDCPVGFTLPPAGSIPWVFPGSMRIGPWVGGVTRARPGVRIKVIAGRVGITMSPQMLRRSWATRAEVLGIPQALLTRQMRHTDEQTTKQFYQQRELSALIEALAEFDY